MSTLDTKWTQRDGRRIYRKERDEVRIYWCNRFGISRLSKKGKMITPRIAEQLDACVDDMARRIILGIAND